MDDLRELGRSLPPQGAEQPPAAPGPPSSPEVGAWARPFALLFDPAGATGAQAELQALRERCEALEAELLRARAAQVGCNRRQAGWPAGRQGGEEALPAGAACSGAAGAARCWKQIFSDGEAPQPRRTA